MRFENGARSKVLNLKKGEVKGGWINETMRTGNNEERGEEKFIWETRRKKILADLGVDGMKC